MSRSTTAISKGKAPRTSFSARIKEECAHAPLKRDCCARAELAGWTLLAGNLGLMGGGRLQLTLPCDSPDLAARALALSRRLFHIDGGLRDVETARLGHAHHLLVAFEDGAALLRGLSILRQTAQGETEIVEGIDESLTQKDCCRRALLRGAFLGAGSVVDPKKEYHLEYIATREAVAQGLRAVLEGFSLNARSVARKEKFVVYLKEGENISDLLSLIGAHVGVMEWENARALKDMRNHINRTVNCETANSAKVARTAARQMEGIERIERAMGLEALPAALEEVARARLEYPDATLVELGQMLSPPVGKSGVNHRLKRLEKLADALNGG